MERYTRAFHGLSDERIAGEWLDECERWFKQVRPDWNDFTIRTRIYFSVQANNYVAEFTAEK